MMTPEAHKALKVRLDGLVLYTPEQARAAKARPLTYPFAVRMLGQLQALFDCLGNFTNDPDSVMVVQMSEGKVEVWRR